MKSKEEIFTIFIGELLEAVGYGKSGDDLLDLTRRRFDQYAQSQVELYRTQKIEEIEKMKKIPTSITYEGDKEYRSYGKNVFDDILSIL